MSTEALHQSRRKIVRAGLLAVLAFWGVIGAGIGVTMWANRESVAPILQPNQPAPMWELTDQDGRTHRLKDYAGRAVALVFLPDGNARTTEQLRSLNSEIRQFDTLGVKLFAIAPLDAPTAKRLHDAEDLNFPILLDPGQRTAQRFGAAADKGNPDRRVSYVIGGDGQALLPIVNVQAADHGKQLVELSECCLDSKPLPGSKLIGKPIPNFTLPRVRDNAPETLYGDRKQKATVLLIMSAQCPCSRKYDSRNVELAQQYAGKGVRFVAMNSSHGETASEIAAHAQSAGYPYPVMKDDGNRLADRLEARVTPEVFVMDAAGVLRYHGRIDDNRDAAKVTAHDLRNALDFLLAGKNPPRPEQPMFGCAIARAPKS